MDKSKYKKFLNANLILLFPIIPWNSVLSMGYRGIPGSSLTHKPLHPGQLKPPIPHSK